MNLLAISIEGVNDTVTALLAVLVASMLRVIWSMQQRVSRLEGIDEMRERRMSTERTTEPYDWEKDDQTGST